MRRVGRWGGSTISAIQSVVLMTSLLLTLPTSGTIKGLTSLAIASQPHASNAKAPTALPLIFLLGIVGDLGVKRSSI